MQSSADLRLILLLSRADLKALLERAGFVALSNENAFCWQIGAAVVAVRRGGATHAFDTIKSYVSNFTNDYFPARLIGIWDMD